VAELVRPHCGWENFLGTEQGIAKALNLWSTDVCNWVTTGRKLKSLD
jgi:hypothetical protein